MDFESDALLEETEAPSRIDSALSSEKRQQLPPVDEVSAQRSLGQNTDM